MNKANQSKVNILGVKIGTQSLSETIDFIDQAIDQQKRVIIQYINIHAINLAQGLPWFKSFLNFAHLTYCDGYGIKLAARILGASIPERYTLPDWFSKLIASCEQKGRSIFILGAKPGIAEKVANQTREEYPKIKIVGAFHGYFDKNQSSPENQKVIAMINHSNPDILAVGFGMPLQEKWLMENWDKLNCRVAIPMGAAIDYLAGTIPRAPRWMTDHGLEWLGRLAFEPNRLWERYLLGIPRFYYNVLKQKFGFFSAD